MASVVLAPTNAQHHGLQIPLSEGTQSQNLTTSGTAATSTVVSPADLKGVRYVWTIGGTGNGQWARFSRTSPVAEAAVGTGHFVPGGALCTCEALAGQSVSLINA